MSVPPKPARQGDYLAHMLEAIRLARNYVQDMSKADFLSDTRTQQAVILNLVILGEAATKLATECPEFVTSHPALPWKQMRGMRNRMAHGYFEIDLDIVWDTTQSSLPDLECQLLSMVGR